MIKTLRASSKRSSFTLIELLVVIAIMAIITGVALPSINKLMSGSGVTIGASGIASKLRLARSTALSKRRPVALISPDGQSFNAENPNANRAFRLAYVSRDRSTPGTYRFENWVGADTWDFVEPGVYIRFIEDPAPPVVTQVDLKSIGGSTTSDVRALIYSPSGRPISSDGGGLANGDFMKIEIGEGFFEGNKLNDKTNAFNKLSVGIDAYVGRVETFGNE